MQELGNYRSMAPLALLAAQSLPPELARMDGTIASLTREVADGCTDDDKLFNDLSGYVCSSLD